MADNTELASGSGGDTLATDDIGGVKFPRSKIVIGADGTNDGDVSSANPLPVTGTLTAVTAITDAVTVINAGTFATQATQAGTWTVDLSATDNAVLDAIAAALAGTLTVGTHAVSQSGTWTVELGATDNAVLDAIAASLAGTLTVGSHAVTNAGTFAVQLSAALPAGTNAIGKLAANSGVDIGNVGIKSAQTLATVTTVSTLTGSGVAHDAADSGNPHKIGTKAITAWPAAVAASDRANAVGDKFGRLLVASVPRELRQRQVTTITSSTAETTIVTAGAAGVFNDLYSLQITNTSATAVTVTIKDSTAGTTIAIYGVPAGTTAGFTLPSCDAIPQTTAANNWTATSSASVASLVILALYTQMKDA